MAISTQKFLPSPKTSLVKIKSSKGTNVSSLSLLKDIEIKVTSIDSFLKKSLVVKKDQIKKEKTISEKQKFRNVEKELEKKVSVKKFPGINLPKPKLGIFDWIRNFATNVLLGFVLVRVIDYLPKLLKLVPIINSAMDFVIDWGGKLLEGLVNFVDFGYKAVDATRGFVSGIFGEDGVKKFDEFSTKFRDIVNYSLIAAMLIGDIGDDVIGGLGPDQNLGFSQKTKPKITTSEGKPLGKPDFRNPLRQRPRITVGRGGTKSVLKFIRPFTKRLPIIGAFLDFALSIALGESIGRAAFKGIGAGVLGAIGTAAGSIVPFAGNLIGGIAGAALGDWAGGALYDLFFENKKAKKTEPQKVYKHAEGGSVRGGTYTGGPARREIKKAKSSRTLKIAPTPLTPGRSVGGNVKDSKSDKTKIQLFYPKSTSTKEVKPYEFVEKSYKASSKTSFIGSLFGLAIKTIFGDRPTPIDYQNISFGINSWTNVIIDRVKTGYRAFAGGGLVLSENEEQDLRNWLNITIQNSVHPRVNEILKELMRQLLLKPITGPGGPNPSPLGGKDQRSDPNAQFQGEANFVIGDSIAHGFAGRSGNGTDTSDSKVGRKPAEVLAILKSKGEALRGKLIDLSSGIANGTSDWAIVEEQLKYLQSMEARVRLLGVGKQWDEKAGGNQVNAKLEQLARQYGAYFYGGHNASGDAKLGVHGSTKDYEELKHRLSSTANLGVDPGPGSNTLRFGRTGSMSVAAGWSHAHFDTVNGTPESVLINDMIPLLNKMASQGLKPELANGTPILAGKDANYYADIVRSGIRQHTHRPGPRMDVNMPGFPFVPFPLRDVRNTPSKGEGVNALVPGSGKTALFHLGTKPNGYAFHGRYITGQKPKIIKTHDGEYIIDKDSVDSFGLPFIDLVNRIENQQQLKKNIDKLMTMLDYEYEGSQTYIVEEEDEYYGQPTVAYIGLGNMSAPSNEDDSWHRDSLNAQ